MKICHFVELFMCPSFFSKFTLLTSNNLFTLPHINTKFKILFLYSFTFNSVIQYFYLYNYVKHYAGLNECHIKFHCSVETPIYVYEICFTKSSSSVYTDAVGYASHRMQLFSLSVSQLHSLYNSFLENRVTNLNSSQYMIHHKSLRLDPVRSPVNRKIAGQCESH